MITVLFENVGEGNERSSFTAEVREFDGQDIIRAIKKSRLLRGEPDVWYDKERTHGKIWLGGYKPVGTFRILKRGNTYKEYDTTHQGDLADAELTGTR